MRKKKEESPNSTTIRDVRIEPYFICKDTHCYTVLENVIPTERYDKNKKISKDYTRVIGHYMDFGSCLKKIAQQKTNLNQNYNTINEYLETYNVMANTIKNLTEIGI